MDMSTPLLPEVVPEIDANPVSFYSGEGGVRVSQLPGVEGVCKIRRMQQICCFHWAPKAKSFSASGGFALNTLTRGSALDPAGSSAPKPRYRLTLRALAMRVHPTFFDLATPLVVGSFLHRAGKCTPCFRCCCCSRFYLSTLRFIDDDAYVMTGQCSRPRVHCLSSILKRDNRLVT